MDRDIAMVFQNYALYPHMSVADNMAFGLKMRKFDEGRDREARQATPPTSSASASCCTASRASSRAASASAWRSAAPSCAIPRCSCSTSRFPTSTPSCACRCASSSRSCTSGWARPSIYVTHDQVEAMTLGDRVVVMKDGGSSRSASRSSSTTPPANRFVAGFIGSPAMNFADVTLSGSDGKLWAEAPGPQDRPARARIAAPRQRPQRRQGDHGHPARGPPYRRPRRSGRALLRGRGRGDRAAGLGDPARHARRQQHLRRLGRTDAAHQGARAAASSRSTPTACTCSTPRPKRRSSLAPCYFGPDPGLDHVPLGLALLGAPAS